VRHEILFRRYSCFSDFKFHLTEVVTHTLNKSKLKLIPYVKLIKISKFEEREQLEDYA
jgi:hypothetical protein